MIVITAHHFIPLRSYVLKDRYILLSKHLTVRNIHRLTAIFLSIALQMKMISSWLRISKLISKQILSMSFLIRRLLLISIVFCHQDLVKWKKLSCHCILTACHIVILQRRLENLQNPLTMPYQEYVIKLKRFIPPTNIFSWLFFLLTKLLFRSQDTRFCHRTQRIFQSV